VGENKMADFATKSGIYKSQQFLAAEHQARILNDQVWPWIKACIIRMF
jgi:hypothetical protein